MMGPDPFDLLEKRRLRRDEERLTLRKRLADLDTEAAEDATALRVLKKAYGRDDDVKGAQTVVKAAPATQLVQGLFFSPSAEMRVKDIVLSVLAEAAPNGMTAAQIRDKALLKHRRRINPNTLTVSLVRASKQRGDEPPLVQCKGRVWHYLKPTIVPNPETPQKGAGVFG